MQEPLATVIDFDEKQRSDAERSDALDVSRRAIERALAIMEGYADHSEVRAAIQALRATLDTLN